MSDIIVRQNIIDELDFDPSVNSAHIGVAVNNGVVTLNGHVGSYAKKLAAEQAVRRVRGVRAIAEEIKVRFPADKKTADAEIAERALKILRWDAVAPESGIQVKVQDGWVALSGQVEWAYQRRAAESAVRRLSGVVGVVNAIVIQHQAEAADVKAKIEQALKRSAAIEAHSIRVSVRDGGHVTLEGLVHDWHERDVVHDAAWTAPGVTKVEDRLTIS